MTATAVGIDLGTTYSAAAYVDDSGTPTVIPNADGQSTTPSVVLVEGGRRAVGTVALNQWVTNEAHVIRWVKRAMGDPGYTFQGLTAVEISAEILKALKADAEAHLGAALGEVVVTCPAYFAAVEIENTRKAGELAGLRVREIVKEPTAAAVYYGVEHMRGGETVLVCDLGGGTFDATILAYRGGVFMPLASAGDRKLGGHDWTMELVGLVAERLAAGGGDDPRDDPLASQLLYEACEQAKRDFARVAGAVAVPCRHGGRVVQVSVTRDEFEARTEYMVQQVAGWAEGALARANPPLTWKQVDKVLLVGGSSRLRRVGLALQERSGRPPVAVRDPDLAVAFGAAVLARGQVRRRRGLVDAPPGLVEVQTTRILPRAVGTRVADRTGPTPRVRNAAVIPHGTELPVTRSREDFTLSSDRQEAVDVPVVEFDPGDDDGYDLVGNYAFKTAGGKRGDKVRVTFAYDVSGIPAVEAVNLRTGQVLPAERRMEYADPTADQLKARAARPRWVVFAVDVSGSMEGAKLEAAKRAVVENGRRLLAAGEGCKVGVVSFGSLAEVVCDPTADPRQLEAAAGKLAVSGTTAMDLGILQAVAVVRDAPPGTDRDVVLLTDGMPDADRRDQTVVAAAAVKSEGVTLSTLGVGSEDVDLAFLKQLTPHALVVGAATDIGEGMANILTLSAAGRPGGLTD